MMSNSEQPHQEIKIEKNLVISEEYYQSLPAGWSVKNIEVGLGSIIKNFISLTGKCYNSRIEAIRALEAGNSNDSVSDADAEILRSGLSYDGWFQHSLLPERWWAKPMVKEELGSRMKFLTETNVVLKGIKNTMAYMKKHKQFREEHMDNLTQFLAVYTSIKRENDEAWQEAGVGEDSLPPGWRQKRGVSSQDLGHFNKVMSPNGEVFSSRVKALIFMIKYNYSTEDISMMRNSLLVEGWMTSQWLPSEWSYRKCKTDRNEYQFLSPEGDIVQSRRNLVELMSRKPELYTDQDIANIDQLAEEIKAKWVSSRHEWIKDDPSVPPGWSIRYIDHKTRGERYNLMSPCGNVFHLRVRALQWMLTNGGQCPADHVATMFDGLRHDGWLQHDLLPSGWRYRVMSGKKNKDAGVGDIFVSPDATLLTSRSAVTYMEERSGDYSQQDMENLTQLVKQIRQDGSSWSHDQTVPEGWEYRSTPHNGQLREYFKLPSGKQISGRVTLLQYLLKEAGTDLHDPDFVLLRNGLLKKGWSSASDILLKDWFKKEISNKPGQFKYLSPDIKEFASLKYLYHYIKANNYPSEILMTVKKKLSLKSLIFNVKKNSKVKGETKDDWEEVDYLPDGWRMAVRQHKYQKPFSVFLSPTGILYKNSVTAYQALIVDNAGRECLTKMKEKLTEDSWEADQYLPKGWLLNVDKDKFPKSLVKDYAGVLFLSDKANVLTREEALVYLEENSFNQLDREKFHYLVESLEERLEEKAWKSDDTLPYGWRVKASDHGYKKEFQLISAFGETFDSYLSAFMHLVSEEDNVDKEDIKKMKIKLFEEGFEKHENLPKGWLIARNSRGQLFEILTREGMLFQTLDEAQDFLETNESYNDVDILHLEEICMDEVEMYIDNIANRPHNISKIKIEEDKDVMKVNNSREKKRKRKHST